MISDIQKKVNILITEQVDIVCKRIAHAYTQGSYYMFKNFNLFFPA